jgi:hypothetical protein
MKVKGYSHLLRDPKTNSIINNNMAEYQEYVIRRDTKIEESQKVQNLEEDIANMKSDIGEIKNLLRSLINEPK